jgi:hypothetical protein
MLSTLSPNTVLLQGSNVRSEMMQSLEPTTNDTTVKKSMSSSKNSRKSSPGNSTMQLSEIQQSNKEMADLNKRVWRPWWKSYLEKCDNFILAAKKGDYERVAKLINIDFARD